MSATRRIGMSSTGWPLSRNHGGMDEKKRSRCGKVKPASRVQPCGTRARWPCRALQGLPQHAVPVIAGSGANPHVPLLWERVSEPGAARPRLRQASRTATRPVRDLRDHQTGHPGHLAS
jgi:hypothetical protein